MIQMLYLPIKLPVLFHFPEQGTHLLETEKELPAVQHSAVQRLDPLTKIKLQLFPIDEVTCLGLQKVFIILGCQETKLDVYATESDIYVLQL